MKLVGASFGFLGIGSDVAQLHPAPEPLLIILVKHIVLYVEDRDVLLLISQERVEYHHPEDCCRLEEGSGRLQLSQSISCGISQGPEVTELCHHQVSRAWGHPKSRRLPRTDVGCFPPAFPSLPRLCPPAGQ